MAIDGLKPTRIILLLALLPVFASVAGLPASLKLMRIVPPTAEPGDQVLAVGESFGTYLKPQGRGQAENASSVVLVNIGADGQKILLDCKILGWEDTRILFTVPESANMIKQIGDNGFRITQVPVHHFHRAYGKSQFFNFKRLFQVAVDLGKLWVRLVVRKEHLKDDPAPAATSLPSGERS